jgi:hypothetical protein
MCQCEFCKRGSKDLQKLSCGCLVHLECYRKHCTFFYNLECPKCNLPVTKACFDQERSEWIIGIPSEDGLLGCFKVMSNSKVVAWNKRTPKWRRRNGRLVALEILDMNTDIYAI